MGLQIQSSPSSSASPEKIVAELRGSIETALPGADVTVIARSPGHFEIAVQCESFAGRSRVAQQVELAQDREPLRIEPPGALDAQVAQLVELALGPLAGAERLELLLCPAPALRLAQLLAELLG